MRLVNYRCPQCGRDAEDMYLDSEEVPREIPCRCERDVYAVKWNVKNNSQRVRIFDKEGNDE